MIDEPSLREEALRDLEWLQDFSYEAEREKWKHQRPPQPRARITASRLRLALTAILFVLLACYCGAGLIDLVQHEDLIKTLRSLPATTTSDPFLLLFKTGILSAGLLGSVYLVVIVLIMQITYPYGFNLRSQKDMHVPSGRRINR